MSRPTNSNEPQPDPQIGALLAEAGWVLALAKRLARDQAAAEDIAQGTLVLALERRPELGGGLRPWLAKVVGRLARRSVRSELRRQERETQSAPGRKSKSMGTDDVLERFELQQGLARRVDALQEPYRGVLIRRYYEGLSVKEIAVATGASPATVRSQLARGLERLRLQYDDEFEGQGALGIFLIAANSGGGFLARRSAELFLMQTSSKVAAATLAALLVALAVFGPDSNQPDVVLEESEGHTVALAETQPVEPDTSSLVMAPANGDDRVAVRSEVETPLGVVPQVVAAEELAPSVTTLRARIAGENGEFLSGATLSSIHTDGRPRGSHPVAYSDTAGNVVLELEDSSVRKWRDQTLDMLFAASAAGHATTFVLKQPELHGESDLGHIQLEAGGSLVGVSVNSVGKPIAGAVLYAATSVLSQDPSELQISGPDSSVPRPRAISGVDGSFELSGFRALTSEGSAARLRIWAQAPGYFWKVTDPIKVTPRGVVQVGNIVLDEIPAELRIEGRVVGPSGLPVPDARVDFFSKGAPYEGHVLANARGEFLVVAKDDSPLDLVASVRSDNVEPRFGMSPEVTAVRGEEVELRLTERRTLTVRLVDQHGDPVRDAPLRPVLMDGLVPGVDWTYTDDEGLVDMEAPGGRFMVWARKAGYGSAKSEPLDYHSAPDSLTLTLQRGLHLSGRVLAYGEPVAGAKVTAMRRHVNFVAMTGGFPHRYASGVSFVRADEEGRFTAPVKKKWPALGVLAQSEGLATGELQFETLPSESEASLLEIHLTQGGAIEGTVTPPPGMEAAGLYVGASRGDGIPLSTIVDDEGQYRFEGLAPGNWRVEGRLREVGTEMLSISRHPEDMEPHWNVIVEDRKTLKFDVDMSHLGDVEVRGQLLVDGTAPPRGWTAQVVRAKHEQHVTEMRAVELDSDGHFTFTVRPGRVTLRLVGSLPGQAKVEMLREVRLQGPLFEWDGTLLTAPVEEWLEFNSKRARFVRGEADEASRELTIVPVGQDGVLKARVPIGRSSLQTPAKDDPTGKAWEAVRRVEVR